ncbi:MAG: hypothetical protein COV66_01215 [Nitrospinae bacterium CG11_big_fil_rev_8_21_14_0_20_45_15]|nr:MAG: hypothetical protein COV66_01215 [Nitrospinae bacterium CG11_big_fil_rev_8_21_14_0_20_45_15]
METKTLRRVLAKLLPEGTELEPLFDTGEPLEVLAESLRELEKLSRLREWTREMFGIDLAISPQTFFALLDISAINFVETTDRNLEVEIKSLKEGRKETDPVTVGNLNATLRELYRALEGTAEIYRNNAKEEILLADISNEKIESGRALLKAWHNLSGAGILNLTSSWKRKRVEREFSALFPQAMKGRKLEEIFQKLALEMEFYHHCMALNIKWKALNLDLLAVFKGKGIASLMENIQEVGNLLWNVVYKHPKISQSSERAGLQLDDVNTLFSAGAKKS